MSTLYLVSTPIGNLEDFSPRAVRILKEVTLIAAEDTRHTAKLLNHFGIETRSTSFYDHNKGHKLGKVIDALADRGTGLEGPFNVGTGRETSVLELVSGLERVAGVELEVEHQPERAGEVQRVAIDPGSIEREIGWRAGTELADGLARTYAALEAG